MSSGKKCFAPIILGSRIQKSWLEKCELRGKGALCCKDCPKPCDHRCTYASGPCEYYLTEIEFFWKRVLERPR